MLNRYPEDILNNFCFDNYAYKADKFFARRLGVT